MSVSEPSILTAGDRCDRCGAQAYVVAVLNQGADLLFCGHHARQYEDKLREVAVAIHDESDRLVDTPIGPSLLQV
jgi:ribosomal protein L37E